MNHLYIHFTTPNLFYVWVLALGLVALFNKGNLKAQNHHQTSEIYKQETLPSKSKLNQKAATKLEKKFDYRNDQTKTVEWRNKDIPNIKKEDSTILQYFLFGLVILVLGVIISLIGSQISNNKKLKPNHQIYTIEDIEENLHEADVDAFLQQALVNKNYRLAIRLYYLNILKSLSLSNAIDFKKDKTNGAYIREMQRHSQQTLFKKTTYIYEYVWFNEDDPFGANEFEQVQPIFKKMLDHS